MMRRYGFFSLFFLVFLFLIFLLKDRFPKSMQSLFCGSIPVLIILQAEAPTDATELVAVIQALLTSMITHKRGKRPMPEMLKKGGGSGKNYHETEGPNWYTEAFDLTELHKSLTSLRLYLLHRFFFLRKKKGGKGSH